ncbi:hypothetical protein GCM10009602_56400 [Nocardiopsis tropica]
MGQELELGVQFLEVEQSGLCGGFGFHLYTSPGVAGEGENAARALLCAALCNWCRGRPSRGGVLSDVRQGL